MKQSIRFWLQIFLSFMILTSFVSCEYIAQIDSKNAQKVMALRRTNIFSVYLTWEKPDTSNHIVINYLSMKRPKLSNIYFDLKTKNSIIEKYKFSQIGKTKVLKLSNSSWYLTTFLLNDLNYKNNYYFVVGDQVNGFSREFKFKTLPSDDTPIEIIQGGDMKFSKNVVTIAKRVITKDTRAILMGGDLAYGNGLLLAQKNWKQWFVNLNNFSISPSGFLLPIIVAIGNHETKLINLPFSSNETKAPFFMFFFKQNKDKTYFYRTFGKNKLLIVLDSGHIYSHDGEQRKWLKNIFEKFKNIKNKFTLYHVPLYPSARDFTYGLSQKGRQFWLPLFDQYHLAFSLENHDHMMKRTKLLKNNKLSSNGEGTVYLGDGCWGITPRKLKNEWYLAKSINQIHLWRIKLTIFKNNFQAINLLGKVIDQFEMVLSP